MKFRFLARFFQSTLLVLAALFLGGCTIVSYNLQDELPNTKNIASCDIAFTLNLQSASHTNSYGSRAHNVERREALKEKYIKSTSSTLKDLGCNARHAANGAESNLNIRVTRRLQSSALPQEWLTGLSFGLIPSWGTKPDQFRFSFTDRDNDRTYAYRVDEKVYNHIFMFPVFWMSFFTADEQKAYTNALSNFIKSAPQTKKGNLI